VAFSQVGMFCIKIMLCYVHGMKKEEIIFLYQISKRHLSIVRVALMLEQAYWV